MPIYKGTTEITKISDLLTATEHDIQYVYFGDKEVFTVWDTYSGTLPAQFNANGDDLKAYQIYGNTGGVGKETGNLWDGAVEQGSYDVNITPVKKIGSANRCRSSNFVSVNAADTYTIKSYSSNNDLEFVIHYLDSSYGKISEDGWLQNGSATFQTPANCVYIDFIIRRSANQNITPSYCGDVMLTKGSIAPESYVPYGYELDVLTRGANLYNPLTISNYFFDVNGNHVANALWKASDFISVLGQHKYFVGKPTLTMPTTQVYNCWYDANQDFISSYPIVNDDTIVTAPQNAAYIRVCVRTDAVDVSHYEFYEYVATIPIYIGAPALEKDEHVDSESVKVYRRTEQLWDGVWQQGQIDLFDGEIIDSPNFVHTNLIPYQFADKLAFKFFAFSEQGVIAFYDANGDYMQAGSVAWHVGESIEPPDYVTWIDTVPTGAAFARLSFSGTTSEQPITPETAAQVLILDTNTEPSEQTAYIPYLQPTDPPVPLPTLPTVDGATIVEVDSVVQPEKVQFTYRKEDF